jgi:hypothetical protein
MMEASIDTLAEPLYAALPTHQGSETSLDWADKISLLQEKPHIQDLCHLRRQAATCERVDVRQKNGITFWVLIIKQEVFFFQNQMLLSVPKQVEVALCWIRR